MAVEAKRGDVMKFFFKTSGGGGRAPGPPGTRQVPAPTRASKPPLPLGAGGSAGGSGPSAEADVDAYAEATLKVAKTKQAEITETAQDGALQDLDLWQEQEPDPVAQDLQRLKGLLDFQRTRERVIMGNLPHLGHPTLIRALDEELRTWTVVTTFELYFCLLPLDAVSCISRLCQEHRVVKKLNLGSCGLDDEGARLIARVVQENTPLEKLELWEQGITDVGMETLAAAMSTKTTLKELSVKYANLSDRGVSALGNAWASPLCQVQELCVLECQVTNEGFRALLRGAEANANARALIVSNNPGITPATLPDIGRALQWSSLKVLGLANTSISASSEKELVIAMGRSFHVKHVFCPGRLEPSYQDLEVRELRLGVLAVLSAALKPTPGSVGWFVNEDGDHHCMYRVMQWLLDR